jgi:acetyl esterase/lipase
LFDSYVAPTRPDSNTNPILNPIIAPLSDLPPNIVLIVPTIDILLDEQLKFAERLRGEVEKAKRYGTNAPKRSVEIMIFENCIHGWLEREFNLSDRFIELVRTRLMLRFVIVPSIAIDEKTRERAFKAAVASIKDVHRAHGWNNEAQ